MIKCLRVDHRLLHGQLAFSWTTALGADCILIANDDVMNDAMRKTTIKLAKPSGVKLVIKTVADAIEALNSGVTDKYKLFIVVESIEDAYQIATHCPQVKAVNLGGTKAREGTRSISRAVNVNPDEEKRIQELLDAGMEVEIRMIPVDKSIDARTALREGGGIK